MSGLAVMAVSGLFDLCGKLGKRVNGALTIPAMPSRLADPRYMAAIKTPVKSNRADAMTTTNNVTADQRVTAVQANANGCPNK